MLHSVVLGGNSRWQMHTIHSKLYEIRTSYATAKEAALQY